MNKIAKQLTSQKFILKINSTRLRRANWKLTLPLSEAVKNDEVIKLSNSQVMRFINIINGVNQEDIDSEVQELRKQLKSISKLPKSQENRSSIKQIYSELNNLQFVPEYICVIIDKVKDYRRACKGFMINGLKYKRFVGTTNGVKKETIVFVCESNSQYKPIYDELCRRVNNDRNVTKTHVPAKFEAYKSLSCSSSLPVSLPKGVIVVKDCITKFKSDYIQLDDNKSIEPIMTLEKDQEIELNASDGFGLITPDLAKRWSLELKLDYTFSGGCGRNSFCKGMMYVYDFHCFADKFCNNNYEVTDVWGNKYDIRNVELILTESMLKLWSSYNSIEHYLECCEKNGYTFAITKVTPKKLDNTRNLNYQFIQSYDLTDEEIYQLALPTINEIKSALGGDINKSILFLKGMFVSDDNIENIECDFIKALMIEPQMINDPFVRNKIYQMMKKRINEAKIGTIRVNGNFSMLSGDPFALCQSIFGLEITGLLKAGECYSEYWNNKSEDKVVCMRAPMTCSNNIRVLKLNNSEDTRFWYQYMPTVFIINAWDLTMAAENGCDFDGDMFFTTSNPILIDNTIDLPAIQCVQRTATKEIITEENLIEANINSFGDEIGITTNHVTAMFDVMAKFPKDSHEYKTLDYRIKCGQLFQQNAIDRAKGIVANPMPKEWYDRTQSKILGTDSNEQVDLKTFNSKIVADRKPYFMQYIYPTEKRKYEKYINNTNKRCMFEFQMPISELLVKKDKTEREKEFIEYYYRQLPLSNNNSIMNKLCKLIEGEFMSYLSKASKEYPYFDYSVLKSKVEYSEQTYKHVHKLYTEYLSKVQAYLQYAKQSRIDQTEATVQKSILKDEFKKEAYIICSNQDELCNIVLDICYQSNKSKQFTWDICGDIIINNLLRKYDSIIKYLVKDDDGNVEFCGEHFSVKYKKLGNEEDIYIWQ